MFVDLFSLNFKVKQKTLIGFLVFLFSPPKNTQGKHNSKIGKPSANNMADVSHQISVFIFGFM